MEFKTFQDVTVRTKKNGNTYLANDALVKINCNTSPKDEYRIVPLVGYIKGVTEMVDRGVKRTNVVIFHQVGYIDRNNFVDTPGYHFEHRAIDEDYILSIQRAREIDESGDIVFSNDGKHYVV
jgi:hypothetical protein